MKCLNRYIKEALDKGEIGFKVDTWLLSHPDERCSWDNACAGWNTQRQIDDDAVQAFIDSTDINAFVDFMNDEVKASDGVRPDYLSTVKQIITQYEIS